MKSALFKNTVLPAFVLAMVCFAAPAKADMTKAEVEKIVQEYIKTHGEEIIHAVDDYQRASMETRQNEAMAKNKDALMKDSGSPEVGNPTGDVTIVEFFDYNCGFCKTALPGILELLRKDKNIRIVFKDLPILGPSSESASKWALAAQKQNKYFEYHQALMNNRQSIDDALLEKIAKDVGLNVEQAKKDAASPEVVLQLEKNRALASDLAINGTPAFTIGDDIARGAIPVSEIEKKIAAQRAKVKK